MMSNYSDKADGACKPGWVVSQFQLSVYHNGSIKDMNSRSTLTLWEFSLLLTVPSLLQHN